MSSRRRKILIIFNDLDIGGIQRKIVDLCQHYSPSPNVSAHLLLKLKTGALLPQIPTNVIIESSPPHLGKLTNLLFPLWIKKTIFRVQPNLIVSLGNFCSICSVIGNLGSQTNLIISEDSSIDRQLATDSFSPLRKMLVKLTYPHASGIITLTPASKNKLLDLIPLIKSQTVVLPNWLPYLPLTQSPVKPAHDIDLLFLGRFEPQKDPLRFLEICHQILKTQPKLKAAMVGAGSLKPRIIQYINHHHLSKNILLFPATTNVTSYYQRSKLFLMTSNHEGFPLTILESFYYHCPVVCPDLKEVTDFFDYHPQNIVYHHNRQAVTNALFFLNHSSATRNIITHYRSKIIKSQQSNFQNTLKYFDQYL
jgi:glycosyltransferase involved in cell wall biosynthesis